MVSVSNFSASPGQEKHFLEVQKHIRKLQVALNSVRTEILVKALVKGTFAPGMLRSGQGLDYLLKNKFLYEWSASSIKRW